MTCNLCHRVAPSWNAGSEFQPGWRRRGFYHLCRACDDKLFKWQKWTEEDIVREFPQNNKACVQAFMMTNRLRRQYNNRRRNNKTRMIAAGRIKIKPRKYRPILRRCKMEELGVTF